MTTTWPNNDPRALRVCWLIAALVLVEKREFRAVAEALFNAVRIRPARYWRTGARLVRVEDQS